MPATLSDKVNALIAEHLAQEGGGIVLAFHLTAEYIDSEGDESWLYANAPDQRISRTMGLLEWAKGVTLNDQRRYLDGDS